MDAWIDTWKPAARSYPRPSRTTRVVHTGISSRPSNLRGPRPTSSTPVGYEDTTASCRRGDPQLFYVDIARTVRDVVSSMILLIASVLAVVAMVIDSVCSH